MQRKYDIGFSEYGIFMYHPVTTEREALEEHIDELASALVASGTNFVAIYPNNDSGSEVIFAQVARAREAPALPGDPFDAVRVFPQVAQARQGHRGQLERWDPRGARLRSTHGQRGHPADRRFRHPSILDVPEERGAILAALADLPKAVPPSLHFGNGDSARQFLAILEQEAMWNTSRQKLFRDVNMRTSSYPADPSSRKHAVNG